MTDDKVYVSLHEACEIFKHERLKFGDPRHIAAKNRLKAITSRSPLYEKEKYQEVIRFLKQKYGAKRDEEYPRHSSE